MCNKFVDGRTEGGVTMSRVQFSRFSLVADLLGTPSELTNNNTQFAEICFCRIYCR